MFELNLATSTLASGPNQEMVTLDKLRVIWYRNQSTDDVASADLSEIVKNTYY